MCEMCSHEMTCSRSILGELIKRHREFLKDVEEHGLSISDEQAVLSLATKLNVGVSEHYGVINGQVAAHAIHLVTKGGGWVTEATVTTEQLALVALTMNERRKAEGRSDFITTETIGEILSETAKLAL